MAYTTLTPEQINRVKRMKEEQNQEKSFLDSAKWRQVLTGISAGKSLVNDVAAREVAPAPRETNYPFGVPTLSLKPGQRPRPDLNVAAALGTSAKYGFGKS